MSKKQKSHKPKRKKDTMSLYDESMNEVTTTKELSDEERKELESLSKKLEQHNKALRIALDKVSKMTDPAAKILAEADVKASHIKATATINSRIKELTGELPSAHDITIAVSSKSGEIFGAVIKTPVQGVISFWDKMSKKIMAD